MNKTLTTLLLLALVGCSNDGDVVDTQGTTLPQQNPEEEYDYEIDPNSNLWVYEIPGEAGEKYKSPDYEVTVVSADGELSSFVNYSYGLDYYEAVSTTGAVEKSADDISRILERHSQTTFSFRGEVQVRVKVLDGAQNITLPLTSAKVLPSSYEIPCHIEDGNTIVFTLDRPEKVAVIANYDTVWAKFEQRAQEGHTPIQAWRSTYSVVSAASTYNATGMAADITDGYRNPMIISALAAETDVPDTKGSSKILYVDSEITYTEDYLSKYDVIWFKPGVYDWSRMFGSYPTNYIPLTSGQWVYIEGGAYVMGRFRNIETTGSPVTISGRGIISGINSNWVMSFPLGSQLISIDNIQGVTITDRGSFSIFQASLIEDVTLIGPWHANTDGPDYSDNTIIKNCFLMAADDCLKLNHNTQASHLVLWQENTAHAIMVKEVFRDDLTKLSQYLEGGFSDSKASDIDIIAYSLDPDKKIYGWPKLADAAISCTTAMDKTFSNFVFEDIRVEAPLLYRLFDIYNLAMEDSTYDSWGLPTASWFLPTSESRHTIIDGMHFRNIKVTSPIQAYRSLIGTPYTESINNLTFEDIDMDGTTLTDANHSEYFEIEYDDTSEIIFY